MCILFEGDICRVMTSHHVTPGNLRGFVQAKMRNLRNGNSFEHRFSSTEKVERAILDTQPMEYLYSDPSGHHFMNQDTYEQITLDDEVLGGLSGDERDQLMSLLRRALAAAPPQPLWSAAEGD